MATVIVLTFLRLPGVPQISWILPSSSPFFFSWGLPMKLHADRFSLIFHLNVPLFLIWRPRGGVSVSPTPSLVRIPRVRRLERALSSGFQPPPGGCFVLLPFAMFPLSTGCSRKGTSGIGPVQVVFSPYQLHNLPDLTFFAPPPLPLPFCQQQMLSLQQLSRTFFPGLYANFPSLFIPVSC